MSEKGQSILLDFMLGLFIFVIAWVFINTEFDQRFEESQRISDIESMRVEADFLADSLVRSSGSPDNWEELPAVDVNKIGLAEKDRHLSEEKLVAFSNFPSYDELKEKMGLEEFDFYFTFSGVDGTINSGQQPNGDAVEVNVVRVVTYKGASGIATLTLYKFE